MSSTDLQWEGKLLDSYRLHYEGQGLRFIVQPQAGDLPDFLKEYRPDAVAISGEGGVVLEVKQIGGEPTNKQLQHMVAEIAKHKGWRLDLLLADRSFSDQGYLLPSREEVRLELEKLRNDSLAVDSIGSPAVHLLFGWSLFEAAARRILVDADVELSRNVMNPKELIEHLIIEDFVSDMDGETAVKLMRQRNLVAHGFLKQPITVSETNKLFDLIEKILNIGHPAP